MKSTHQQQIEKFMLGAKQTIPPVPTIPAKEIRGLRASLILEEAIETIWSLGFSVCANDVDEIVLVERSGDVDLVPIADGCADLSVVTIGTLSACGIQDIPVLMEVDQNNLSKLERGTLRKDGKLVKPPGHKPPDLAGVLAKQMPTDSPGSASPARGV